MTDLNELLKDWKDNRLSYKEVNRAKHEALLDGIVDELEALKAGEAIRIAIAQAEVFELPEEKPRRGPGRPPKEPEALNG